MHQGHAQSASPAEEWRPCYDSPGVAGPGLFVATRDVQNVIVGVRCAHVGGPRRGCVPDWHLCPIVKVGIDLGSRIRVRVHEFADVRVGRRVEVSYRQFRWSELQPSLGRGAVHGLRWHWIGRASLRWLDTEPRLCDRRLTTGIGYAGRQGAKPGQQPVLQQLASICLSPGHAPHHHMRADSESMSPSGITVMSSAGGSPTRTVVRPPLNQWEYCNTS